MFFWGSVTSRLTIIQYLFHQHLQVPKIWRVSWTLFSPVKWGWVFPYMSRLYRCLYLHFRYLKCLVTIQKKIPSLKLTASQQAFENQWVPMKFPFGVGSGLFFRGFSCLFQEGFLILPPPPFSGPCSWSNSNSGWLAMASAKKKLQRGQEGKPVLEKKNAGEKFWGLG